MTVYIDTSAAAKLIVEEAESEALARYLDALEPERGPFSSALLETELRRMALRLDLPQSAVTDLLARVALVEPQRSLFHEAGLLPGLTLRSLDALHVATAVRLDGAVVVAYDVRLIAAARAVGLDVASPG
ncbi:MAG: type II toxin-antitoxin system VapC family toxin [Carbonactinosporaceae bacterium]